jgi:hypothetical protein
MTDKFTFGEHPVSIETMRHTMSVLKDFGARVTVETALLTRHNFVLHTVVAEFPPKENPIKFTKAGDTL